MAVLVSVVGTMVMMGEFIVNGFHSIMYQHHVTNDAPC